MRVKMCSPWDLEPREAMRLQERLRERVVLEDRFEEVRFVAGGGPAFCFPTGNAFAGGIVYRFSPLFVVETRMGRRKLPLPFVPRALSFPGTPPVLPAVR